MPSPRRPGGRGDEEDPRKDRDHRDNNNDHEGNGFPRVNNEVAVLFGGHSSRESKRRQKLTDRQVLMTHSPTPTYYQWSEQPISFNRADHWCDFDSPGQYLLVVSPIIRSSILHKTLIDGGSGLNILFKNTLPGLGISVEDLEESDTPFYDLIPGRGSQPLGHITMPVTFGDEHNYHSEYIRFEVADIDCSYNAIIGRLALAKFMAIPHTRTWCSRCRCQMASSPSEETSKSRTSATWRH